MVREALVRAAVFEPENTEWAFPAYSNPSIMMDDNIEWVSILTFLLETFLKMDEMF